LFSNCHILELASGDELGGAVDRRFAGQHLLDERIVAAETRGHVGERIG
jgi:hypothetical protein